MGCDIHCYAEVRDTDGKGGHIWHKIGPMFKNKYVKPGDIAIDFGDANLWCALTDKCFQGRDYVLFGILAGVRGPDVPICIPRGIPSDASDGYKKVVQDWGADGHSHSFYSLRTLLLIEHKRFKKCTAFLSAMKTAWKLLGKKFDIDDIRIVFFFDN